MNTVDNEEDKRFGDSNGEPKIPDYLSSKKKTSRKNQRNTKGYT